jgi:hypothetical protein
MASPPLARARTAGLLPQLRHPVKPRLWSASAAREHKPRPPLRFSTSAPHPSSPGARPLHSGSRLCLRTRNDRARLYNSLVTGLHGCTAPTPMAPLLLPYKVSNPLLLPPAPSSLFLAQRNFFSKANVCFPPLHLLRVARQ